MRLALCSRWVLFERPRGDRASKNDTYPARRTDIVNTHNNEKKKIIYEIIAQNFGEFLNKTETDLNNALVDYSYKLYEGAIAKVLSQPFNEKAYKMHNNIVTDERQLRIVIQAYSSIISTKRNIINQTLNNIKGNKEVLIEQAKEIKESSIEPSFKLLFNTQENIQKVKALVDTVSFI